ncbi:MAG: diguanylate cyclase [Desulfuromonadales bacterium]|nr:diguanylate cyclase [Desulfuromonadales bacterium]
MIPLTPPLQRLILTTAWSISLLIAVAAPGAYFLVSHQNLRTVLESQAELAVDAVSRIVAENPKLWRFEEARLSELLQRRAQDGVPERKRILNTTGDVIAGNNVTAPSPLASYSLDIYDAGTSVANLEVSRSMRPLLNMTLLVAACSSIIALLLFFIFRTLPIRIITKALQALEENEKKYRLLYETMKEGVALHRMDFDEKGELHSLTVIDANPSCAAMFDGNLDRVIGSNSYELFGDTFREFLSERHTQEQGDSIMFELCLPGTDDYYSVHVFSPDRGLIATLFEDVTERRKSEQQIQHMAFFDRLTELPNRTLFFDRLNQAIANGNRECSNLAVLFLDLDRFKNINDTLGHDAGDQLLIEVSQRLLRHIRNTDTLARMGGDEFVFVITGTGEQLNAAHVARKLTDSFQAPFLIKGRELHVTSSIGIALFPENGSNAETLLKNADQAMYHAKKSGRNAFKFYTPHRS